MTPKGFDVLLILQVVPVYNDIEGDVQAESFLLNAPSLLQEIDPRFQKNVRGYRQALLLISCQTLSIPWGEELCSA